MNIILPYISLRTILAVPETQKLPLLHPRKAISYYILYCVYFYKWILKNIYFYELHSIFNLSSVPLIDEKIKSRMLTRKPFRVNMEVLLLTHTPSPTLLFNVCLLELHVHFIGGLLEVSSRSRKEIGDAIFVNYTTEKTCHWQISRNISLLNTCGGKTKVRCLRKWELFCVLKCYRFYAV